MSDNVIFLTGFQKIAPRDVLRKETGPPVHDKARALFMETRKMSLATMANDIRDNVGTDIAIQMLEDEIGRLIYERAQNNLGK